MYTNKEMQCETVSKCTILSTSNIQLARTDLVFIPFLRIRDAFIEVNTQKQLFWHILYIYTYVYIYTDVTMTFSKVTYSMYKNTVVGDQNLSFPE